MLQAAERFFFQQSLESFAGREEAFIKAHGQQRMVCACGFNHRFGLGHGAGHRLFAEHGRAFFERVDCRFGVKFRRRGDHNEARCKRHIFEVCGLRGIGKKGRERLPVGGRRVHERLHFDQAACFQCLKRRGIEEPAYRAAAYQNH